MAAKDASALEAVPPPTESPPAQDGPAEPGPDPEQESWLRRPSLAWYVPITGVLTLGFLTGAALSFGTAFLGWFPWVGNPAGRAVLQHFGMGLLGVSIYGAKWWSRDHELTLDDPPKRPTAFDFVGYAFTLAAGGVTGWALVLLVPNGVALISTAPEVPLRPGMSHLLALIGGLATFGVQTLLVKLFRKLGGEST